MEELLPQLLAFPQHPQPLQKLSDTEYDRHIKALVQLLNQTPASKLIGPISGGGDLLDIIDPSINTLPYLFALLAHVENAHSGKQNASGASKAFSPTGHLWPKMLDFVERFDPIQVRYAGHEWRRLLETVARTADTLAQPMIAIQPIRTAMLRMDPSTSCFTSTHLLFVRLCLQARAFSSALPIIDNNIYHFPSSEKSSYLPLPCSSHDTSLTYMGKDSGFSEKLTYRDHMKYYLYGAMLYMGLKMWDRALLFLEIVLMSPANSTASKIQVEAYSKWVLVCLLLKGRPLSLPRTTSPQAAKHYKALGKAYDAFADVFKEGDITKLYEEFQAAQQIWQNDLNFGLVLQVLNAFRRFSILRLGRTHAAISIEDVARRTSPHPPNVADTHNYVAFLISSGQLNATLSNSSDPKSAILRFAKSSKEGPLARSEAQQHQALLRQTENLDRLATHIKSTDRRIELSKEYLDWVKKMRKSKESGEQGGSSIGNMMGMGNEAYGGIEEEMLSEI